jgi:hypothetical protein
MKLTHPIEIAPNLQPGIRIGKGWITLERDGTTTDSRDRFRYTAILPSGFEITDNDLNSGAGGTSLGEAFETLFSFLGACAESRNYSQRTCREGENADLFPSELMEWLDGESWEHIGLELQELIESGANPIEE